MTTTAREQRELLTYDDIARMTGLKAQSLRVYQRDARARRAAGEARRTDMPAPVGWMRNPASANLPDVRVFDGAQIRTWLRQTDRQILDEGT